MGDIQGILGILYIRLCLLAVAEGEIRGGVDRIPRLMPWVNLEEAEVIEEASRRVGKVPAQFIKDAGLAVALAVLDAQAGRGRGHKAPLAFQPVCRNKLTLSAYRRPERNRLGNGDKESPLGDSLFEACLARLNPPRLASNKRKYCVSGATNIHRKYCVDGFR